MPEERRSKRERKRPGEGRDTELGKNEHEGACCDSGDEADGDRAPRLGRGKFVHNVKIVMIMLIITNSAGTEKRSTS